MKYEYAITAGPGTLIDSGMFNNDGTPISTWGFYSWGSSLNMLWNCEDMGFTIIIGPSDYQEDDAE
jgi:hypothetical protein